MGESFFCPKFRCVTVPFSEISIGSDGERSMLTSFSGSETSFTIMIGKKRDKGEEEKI